jgi:hypothetical protein
MSTGGPLTDVADAYLMHPSLAERAVAVFAEPDRLIDRSLRPLQKLEGLFAVRLGHEAHSR